PRGRGGPAPFLLQELGSPLGDAPMVAASPRAVSGVRVRPIPAKGGRRRRQLLEEGGRCLHKHGDREGNNHERRLLRGDRDAPGGEGEDCGSQKPHRTSPSGSPATCRVLPRRYEGGAG